MPTKETLTFRCRKCGVEKEVEEVNAKELGDCENCGADKEANWLFLSAKKSKK